jgi:hypothetical protein
MVRIGSIRAVQRRDTNDAGEATATGPSDAPAADQDVPVRFGDGDERSTPIGLERIVRLDMVLTAVFVVTAVFAAIVFNGPAQVIGVVVALALFAVGTFAFLMGYFVAVGRSRTQEIAVAELYLLAGKALPAAPKRALLWLLGVQVVTALGTALARPNTDGRAGSTLAFGVLVPMLGLGLNGLASARHGVFGARRRRGEPTSSGAGDDTGADDASDPTDTAAGGDGVPPANHDLD